jgi:hypothetical protein
VRHESRSSHEQHGRPGLLHAGTLQRIKGWSGENYSEAPVTLNRRAPPPHSTTALHRRNPPLHSTATLHRCTPLPHSTAALHRRTPPPHSTAALHFRSSRHPPSHARFSSPFGLHLLEIPIVRGFASSEYRMALSVAVTAAAKVVQEGGQGRTVAHRRLPPRGPGCVQRQVGACGSRLSIVHLHCRAGSPRSDVYYL